MILAIDPGPVESAWVSFRNGVIFGFGKWPNAEIVEFLQREGGYGPDKIAYRECLVIEKIASFGMPVGEEVFETCVWTGRFMQAFGADRCDRITRHQVKINLCGSARAKDANIRQACIDRFGGSAAIKKDGPLYKVSGDAWSALAVALTWCDLRKVGKVA